MIKPSVLKIIPKTLSGPIDLSGSKISAIVGLIISLCTEKKIIFRNFPQYLLDVNICLKMIQNLGKQIDIDENRLTITQNAQLNVELISNEHSIRYTPLIMAALLINNNKVKVPLPGGCKIGDRKIDVYEYIFKKFGVNISINENHMIAETKKKLKVNKLVLKKISTGGTLCALIMSSATSGETLIKNAHVRPEVIDIINLLNKMGARISYVNNSIVVKGTDSLTGANHKLMNDIIEAFTYAIFGATKGKELKIINFPFDNLKNELSLLKNTGAKMIKNNNDLIVSNGKILPIKLKTGPYPEIQSDLQPIFSSYVLFSSGNSFVSDRRFKDRYQYIEELKKLGASIKKRKNGIEIKGNKKLIGTRVRALDIRCGASLINAAFRADGITIITNANEIKRGYENIDLKINSVGGNINFQY